MGTYVISQDTGVVDEGFVVVDEGNMIFGVDEAVIAQVDPVFEEVVRDDTGTAVKKQPNGPGVG